MGGGHDDRRRDLLARGKGDPTHPFVRHEDPLHRGLQTDLGAEGSRAGLQRGRDGAHPAHDRGPRAHLPVAHIADRVMRHHVAGAGLVRARPGPDQPVQRHHGLDLLVLEEPVEDVHDRHRHQPRHIGDALDVQPAEPPRGLQLLGEVADPVRSEPRRRGHEQRPEHVGETADPRLPPLERVGVLLGELGELGVVLRRVVVLDDVAPVGERDEVRAGGDGAIPVALQLEIAQDRVGHQAHDVAQRRDLKFGRVRPRAHRVGRPARLVAGLQHERARAPSWRDRRPRPARCARRPRRSRRTVHRSCRQDRAGAHPGGSRGGARAPPQAVRRSTATGSVSSASADV